MKNFIVSVLCFAFLVLALAVQVERNYTAKSDSIMLGQGDSGVPQYAWLSYSYENPVELQASNVEYGLLFRQRYLEPIYYATIKKESSFRPDVITNNKTKVNSTGERICQHQRILHIDPGLNYQA
jgi:hypothetical protein